ncbi:MAG: hypothetical protein ACREXY_04910, partial [Gammaproteobacteria bacterium]
LMAFCGYLKQSTAVDIGFGPFVDETDGKTAETALTITQPDIRLKKNAGNWAQKNAAQTLTHEENGWYEVSLDTTDTNTLGFLIIAIHESGALPVRQDYMVIPAAQYEELISGTAILTAAGIADAVWDETKSGHVAIGTFGLGLQGVIRQNTCQTDGSPDSTHLVLDASASATDDIYNGLWLAIVAGTGRGQSPRAITDYVGATKRVLLDPALTTLGDNTTEFAIFN